MIADSACVSTLENDEVRREGGLEAHKMMLAYLTSNGVLIFEDSVGEVNVLVGVKSALLESGDDAGGSFKVRIGRVGRHSVQYLFESVRRRRLKIVL